MRWGRKRGIAQPTFSSITAEEMNQAQASLQTLRVCQPERGDDLAKGPSIKMLNVFLKPVVLDLIEASFQGLVRLE